VGYLYLFSLEHWNTRDDTALALLVGPPVM